MNSATDVPLVSSLPTAATTTGAAGRAPCLAGAALLSLASVFGSGVAQEVVEIGDRITCPSCVIEVGTPITLAAPTQHVYFTSLPPPILARDREGNYIVARVGGDAVVAVFGPDGRFRSSYGRLGEGPEEFAAVPMGIAVGERDVIYAIDPQHLHTLAPQAERGLDKVQVPVFANAAVVLESGIAVQATLRTEAGITTVQILQPDGTIQASIGIAETKDEADPQSESISLPRVLGRSNDGADVWIGPLDRYQIIRLGPDGGEQTRIERVSEWFQPYSNTPGAPFRAPAGPRLGGIHQDAEGLLWTAISRAPHDFSPASETPSGVEGPRLGPFIDMNRFLHVTVEVLDPVTGELIARHAFDEFVRFVSTPDDDVLVYSLHPDSLGNIDCVIRPLKLQRP